jgi:hypothetical protein
MVDRRLARKRIGLLISHLFYGYISFPVPGHLAENCRPCLAREGTLGMAKTASNMFSQVRRRVSRANVV